MEVALNGQLNAELYSAYLYWSMAAYLADRGFAGMSHWMETQAKEELSHTARFYKFIIERGGKVTMAGIQAPPTEWGSIVELFDRVLAHERKVTGLINELVDLAVSSRDHATNQFLQWFVAEQVEEEDNASTLLSKIRFAEGDAHATMMVDQELSQRIALFDVIPVAK